MKKLNINRQKKIFISIVTLFILSFATFVYANGGPLHNPADPHFFINFERQKDRILSKIEQKIEKLEKDEEKASQQTPPSFQSRSFSMQEESTPSNESSAMEDIDALKDKIAADTDPATLREDLKAFRELEHTINKNLHSTK